MFEDVISVSSRNIKLWSTVGPRATVGLALLELAKVTSSLMVVTADVSSSAGLDRFRKQYPENFVDVGIAEQNMLGVASGLADNGLQVFTTTFAPFQTLRCLDQIKVNLAYSNVKVIMIGLASGLVNGPLGSTHCCIEDVGSLRSIPNIIICSPADGLSLVKTIHSALDSKAPVYIRLTGGTNHPIVYSEDIDYAIGKAVEITTGTDLTIFAAGSVVSEGLAAVNLLKQSGISAGLIDMHTIKPLDLDAIRRASVGRRLIVTIEEHNIIGGLGSALLEALSDLNIQIPTMRIGVSDVFLQPGSYSYMLKQAGLDATSIAQNIAKFLNNDF